MVAAPNVEIGFVRADRQSHTVVAAMDRWNDWIYLRSAQGMAWEAIRTPSHDVNAMEVLGTSPPAPIKVEITDANGDPVSGLALNGQDWPILNAADLTKLANPLTVKVIVNNPTAQQLNGRFEVVMGSGVRRPPVRIWAADRILRPRRGPL